MIWNEVSRDKDLKYMKVSGWTVPVFADIRQKLVLLFFSFISLDVILNPVIKNWLFILPFAWVPVLICSLYSTDLVSHYRALLSKKSIIARRRSNQRAFPGLVGKMYSKIQSCGRMNGMNHSRHKGHKDRTLLYRACWINLKTLLDKAFRLFPPKKCLS